MTFEWSRAFLERVNRRRRQDFDCGASVGGMIFSPLWIALIGWFGFAVAASIVGSFVIGIVLLLTCHVFTRIPEGSELQLDSKKADTRGIHPDQRIGTAHSPPMPLWRNGAFVTLSAGMAIGLFAQIGLLAHLFYVLSPALGAQWVGWLMSVATVCAIGGRYIAAVAVQRFGHRRAVAAAGYFVQAIGSAILLLSGGHNPWLITLGVVLLGSGIGNATSIPPLIAQSDFAPQDVSRVVALIVAIGQGTYAFAPAFFGLLLTEAPGQPGSVDNLFFAAAGIQLLASAAYLAYRGPRNRSLADAAG